MRRSILLLAVLALIGLNGCVSDNRPGDSACQAPAAEIALTVTADSMSPNDPAVCRDQEVTLVVTAEVSGAFHIHGYDESVPATEIVDGQVTEIEFTAAESGQFPIELHPNDDPTGVNIGIFTVHEP